jgi:methanogenic corrinoid protein MtbC1
LTPHRIRAWEKRYRAITPTRTETNRRLYSDEDVERLMLLRRATIGQRSISRVAHLSTPELRQLVRDDERSSAAGVSEARDSASIRADIEDALKASLGAVKALDPIRLQETLEHATVNLGRARVMERVVVPLMHLLGDGWRDGTLRLVHEHIASAVVRTYLGELNTAFQLSDTAPEVVVATPLGQLHELGALMAASMAISEGWRATYLGPEIPAETIAESAASRRARAVALSILYPLDDPTCSCELERLAHLLPPAVTLIVGGGGAVSYRDVLDRARAVRLDDYDGLRRTLERLRTAHAVETPTDASPHSSA